MENASNTKYPFNVYWMVRDITVPYAVMQAKLMNGGFPADDIAMPSDKQQVARCVKSFHTLRGANRTIADKLGDSGYALLGRETKGDGETIVYGENTRVTIDETGFVDAVGDRAEEFKDRLDNRFKGNVNADDIRAWVLRYVEKCGGVPKRPSGGIYNVAGRFRAVFEQIKELLRSLGNDSDLYIERVWAGEIETENILASLHDYVNRRIGDIESAAKDIRRKSKADTISNEVQAMKELDDIYTDALGEQGLLQDELARLAAVESSLNDAYAEFAEKKAERPASPLEVAVAVRETAVGGWISEEEAAAALVAAGTVKRSSSVGERVRRAIADGYRGLAEENGGFRVLAEEAVPEVLDDGGDVPEDAVPEALDDTEAEPDVTAEPLPAELPDELTA